MYVKGDTMRLMPVWQLPSGSIWASRIQFRVRGDVLKFGDDIRRVRIEFAEVAVHHLNAAVNLLIADVFGAIVVNDVEDNGMMINSSRLKSRRLGSPLQPLIGLSAASRAPVGIEKRLFHHPLSAVADVRGRWSVLSGSHRGKQQGSRAANRGR